MSENKTKLGQEQAFPSDYTGNSDREIGMSQRFYAACAAMQGIISCGTSSSGQIGSIGHIEDTIKYAYKYADELLKRE